MWDSDGKLRGDKHAHRYILESLDDGSDTDPDGIESEIDASDVADVYDEANSIARLPVRLEPGKDPDEFPSHLWRLFHPLSGIGYHGSNPSMDPRRGNNVQTIPMGFLPGFLDNPGKPVPPVSSLNRRRLQYMIHCHIRSYSQAKSKFTSWTQMLETAFDEATSGGTEDNITIALVDTTCMEEHVEIFYTRELEEHGYHQCGYGDELLVYGPIRGPAYHTASLRDLNKQGLSKLRAAPESNLRKLSSSSDTNLTPIDVNSAKNVASVFHMTGIRGLEMLIAVTVDFVVMRLHCLKELGTFGSEGKVEAIRKLLADTLEEEIGQLAIAVKQGHRLCLAPRVKNYPDVEEAFEHMEALAHLLTALEEDIRSNVTDPNV